MPTVWRDDNKKERRLGAIVARGGIWRDVAVHLIALRALGGDNGPALRRYILGLALVSAIEPQDGFLRQGCLVTPDPAAQGCWTLVHRDGWRDALQLDSKTVQNYAKSRAETFVVGPNQSVSFRKELAKKDADDQKEKDEGKRTVRESKKAEAAAAQG